VCFEDEGGRRDLQNNEKTILAFWVSATRRYCLGARGNALLLSAHMIAKI